MNNSIGWELIPLFSKPLSMSSIDENISDQLVDMCRDVEWVEDSEDTGYNSSWSLNRYVLNETDSLKEYFTQVVKSCIKDILEYDTEIQITSSWFVRTFPDGSSVDHSHCNSWFSAVVYFGDYDDDSSELVLQTDPHMIMVNKTDNIFNSHRLNIKPKHGMLVMFPSEVRHHATKNKSKKIRYCLAFNIMPKGLSGIGDSSFSY